MCFSIKRQQKIENLKVKFFASNYLPFYANISNNEYKPSSIFSSKLKVASPRIYDHKLIMEG